MSKTPSPDSVRIKLRKRQLTIDIDPGGIDPTDPKRNTRPGIYINGRRRLGLR